MSQGGKLAALTLLAVGACTSVRVDARTFEGTTWHVRAINGQPTAAGSFSVQFSNGQIGGQFGCNRFSGGYQVSGDVMTTGPIAATQMACDSALDTPSVSPMRFESWGFAILGRPMRLTWKDGRRLTLGNAAGSIELERAT